MPESSLKSSFRAQAYNNAWANHRLHNVCKHLSAGELAATRESFFPSIIATLNHILIADWFYVSAFEGASMGPKAFENHVPFPIFSDFCREQRASDARLIAVCEALDADSIYAPVEMIRSSGTQVDRFDRIFLHLIQHQIHHRGQIHSMLSAAGVKPPQLDEFYPVGEADLRKSDFEDLGFTESGIWGEG